jgi:hypothetical protein
MRRDALQRLRVCHSDHKTVVTHTEPLQSYTFNLTPFSNLINRMVYGSGLMRKSTAALHCQKAACSNLHARQDCLVQRPCQLGTTSTTLHGPRLANGAQHMSTRRYSSTATAENVTQLHEPGWAPWQYLCSCHHRVSVQPLLDTHTQLDAIELTLSTAASISTGSGHCCPFPSSHDTLQDQSLAVTRCARIWR